MKTHQVAEDDTKPNIHMLSLQIVAGTFPSLFSTLRTSIDFRLLNFKGQEVCTLTITRPVLKKLCNFYDLNRKYVPVYRKQGGSGAMLCELFVL